MFEKINIEQSTEQEIQAYVVDLRHCLTPGKNKQQEIASALNKILSILPDIHKKIYSIMSFYVEQNKTTINHLTGSKLFLYYFQLINLTLINMKQPQHSLTNINIQMIIQIFHQFIKVSKYTHKKTFKAFLIFYFNLIKKINQQFIANENPQFIFQLLKSILKFYFISQQQQQGQKQTQQQEETQWLGMIFQTLPSIKWTQIHPNFQSSFVKNYFNHISKIQQTKLKLKQKRHAQFNMLHMLGNFLQLVIQSRTTTELVEGFQCPIQDVRQMYSTPNINKLCNFRLNQADTIFICELLIKYYREQKQIFSKMFENRDESLQRGNKLPDGLISTRTQSENEDFHKMIKQICQNEQQSQEISIGQLILQTINVLNCLLFLGGYSSKIQDIIYERLFQNDLLPEFLQLAYLIYTERRFMGKYSIKVNMAKNPDSNLSKILKIKYQTFSLQEKKSIFKLVSLEIKFGQLSILLRLMTNLIHINNRALQYFQQNIKYLHIVMSLTHQSQINLTMKNWALLFIKNSCDSPKLRQEINQVKIEMKVDQ